MTIKSGLTMPCRTPSGAGSPRSSASRNAGAFHVGAARGGLEFRRDRRARGHSLGMAAEPPDPADARRSLRGADDRGAWHAHSKRARCPPSRSPNGAWPDRRTRLIDQRVHHACSPSQALGAGARGRSRDCRRPLPRTAPWRADLAQGHHRPAGTADDGGLSRA